MEPSAVLQEMNAGRVNEALLTSGDRVIFSALADFVQGKAPMPRVSVLSLCFFKIISNEVLLYQITKNN